MRGDYEKPAIKVEEYELNTAIATGYSTVVDLGPEAHTYNGTYYTICSYFGERTYDSEDPAYMTFFENCSCYLSSGVEVFTS